MDSNMAIAIDTSAQIESNSSSVTMSYTNAGDYLFVNVPAITTGVTYNGTAMSLLVSLTPSAAPFGTSCPPISVYGLASPSIGTSNIVITLSASGTYFCHQAVSYSGVGLVGQPDASISNATTGGQVTGLSQAITSVKDNDWIIGFFRSANNSTRTFTAKAGSVSRAGGFASVSDPAAIADLNAAKAPGSWSVGVDYSGSTGFMSVVVLAISPAVYGGGTLLPFFK